MNYADEFDELKEIAPTIGYSWSDLWKLMVKFQHEEFGINTVQWKASIIANTMKMTTTLQNELRLRAEGVTSSALQFWSGQQR